MKPAVDALSGSSLRRQLAEGLSLSADSDLLRLRGWHAFCQKAGMNYLRSERPPIGLLCVRAAGLAGGPVPWLSAISAASRRGGADGSSAPRFVPLPAGYCPQFAGDFVPPVAVSGGPAPRAPGFRPATAAGPAQPIRGDFALGWFKRIADASSADRVQEGRLPLADFACVPGFVLVKTCDPL
jgi:hypothetical protein